MAKNTLLLQKKLEEKMANIQEMKDTFVALIEGFVGEAEKQLRKLLAVNNDSVLMDCYMDIMKIMDKCLNSFVMLTACTESLQDNFLESMIGLLASIIPDKTSLQCTDVATNQPKSPSKKMDLSTLHKPDVHSLPDYGKIHRNVHSSPAKQLPVASEPIFRSTGVASQIVTETLDEEFLDYNKNNKSYLEGKSTRAATWASSEKFELYIGNLETHVSVTDVEDLVREFHHIDVRVKKKKDDCRKVFAFATFSCRSDAINCLNALHQSQHRGRSLNVRFVQEEKCKLTYSSLLKTDLTSKGSPENDSCYNDLVADLRGNYTICYPKYMEPINVTKEELREKFLEFGDFSEIHFSAKMIFVRFRTKRAAVAAMERYCQLLHMTIATLKKFNKKETNDSNEMWDTVRNNQILSSDSSYYTPQTSQELNDQTFPGSYQSGYNENNGELSWEDDEKNSNSSFCGQTDNHYCLPSVKKKNQTTGFTEEQSGEDSNDGIHFSYIKQLKKIWKD